MKDKFLGSRFTVLPLHAAPVEATESVRSDLRRKFQMGAYREAYMALPRWQEMFAMQIMALTYVDETKDPDRRRFDTGAAMIYGVIDMLNETVEALALAAFESMKDEDREELVSHLAAQLRKQKNVDAVTDLGKKAIARVVGVLVDRELEAMQDVLLHRIAELVASQWETQIEAVVRRKVDEALAKVKAEIAK